MPTLKVLEIDVSGSAKVAFAEKAKHFEAVEFENFKSLFACISDIQSKRAGDCRVASDGGR
ncbi:MAG: hypothetical protein HY881_12305 [Deltaproteobacteria bacterium]|nr:hypothetical protein [Deltaproteobacteria bacterium]